ncbi:FAD:protein FMN transferase [Candidatus Halobeggiatoa sp. HSG11]|nr:FAD:protein FMN transferase [Candidatus Halobeggiatoa sp. HSG11]
MIKIYKLIFLTIFLSGCGNQIYQQQLYVFGTLVEIKIWGVNEQVANDAINIIGKDFQTMHNNWHPWQEGLLTDLNKTIANGQTWTVKDPSLLSMLKQAQQLYNQSDGLFNPAIGKLIALWGFHTNDLSNNFTVPSAKAINKLLTPSMNDIEINGEQISSKNSDVQLDFGAFAKGYAIDIAINKLKQLGINNAIVNAGGNLKAIGKKGQQPWVIGVRHPTGSGILAAITVNGEESIITSGDYERFHELEGNRYSHIIDPRNGKPTEELTSVTVIHKNGAIADAAATALTIAGLKNWHKIAKQMGIEYAMLVDKNETIYINPAMQKRVQFQTIFNIVVTEKLK